MLLLLLVFLYFYGLLNLLILTNCLLCNSYPYVLFCRTLTIPDHLFVVSVFGYQLKRLARQNNEKITSILIYLALWQSCYRPHRKCSLPCFLQTQQKLQVTPKFRNNIPKMFDLDVHTEIAGLWILQILPKKIKSDKK